MLPFSWTSNKQSWSAEEIIFVERQLYEFMGRECEIQEEKQITNTSLDCYAVPDNIINDFANFFLKGNYIQFLEKSSNNSHPMTLVRGKMICQIRDAELFKKFLDDYTLNIDSRSHCDFFNIALMNINPNFVGNVVIVDYIKSNNIYRKRVAFTLLKNHFMDWEDGMVFTLKCIAYLANEKHEFVYPLMVDILFECYLKNPDLTIKMLKDNQLNDLIIKSFLNKCKKTTKLSKKNFEMLSFLNSID